MRFIKSAFAVITVTLTLATGLRAEPVTVFAAASLTNALQDVAKAYEQRTGKPMRFSFAASSALAKQIESGAPAQIFASADEKWMDYLSERNLILKESRVSPIGNALVLIAPADSTADKLTISESLDLNALLGLDGRIAVGDPNHVPAGIYAKEAFTSLKLWDEAEPRLARADNVRAALALVETGEAPLGVVYATDAAASKRVKVLGRFPEGSHTPVTYPFALVAGQDNADARAAFEFLTGGEAKGIFAKYGFTQAAGS